MIKNSTKGDAITRVVYPGIAAWLTRNNTTVHAFALSLGYQPKGAAAVYNCICGKVEPSMRMIRKILAATGTTFEEAFGRDDANA